jgi:hypothetical protein
MAFNHHITFSTPEALLSLSERLATRARRARNHGSFTTAGDLRLAAYHIRKLAGLMIRIDALSDTLSEYDRDRLNREARDLAAEQYPAPLVPIIWGGAS